MSTALATLVDASARAAATSSRLAKRDAIADLLRGAAPDEVEIAVAWLSGEARQGRIGVGWATLSALRGAPAAEPTLTLRDADSALAAVAAAAGKGSTAARSATLRALFDRATAGRAGLPRPACSSASCARARSKA
jgi:DNA ligase-1